MAFDYYGALRTEAESTDIDLDEYCSKVEQVWVEGSLTDERRSELKQYASERSAEAGMSLADLAAAVPQDSDSETVTIEDRVTTLELAVAELGEMGV